MRQPKNLPILIGVLCGALLCVVVTSIGIIRYKMGMILRNDQTLSYVYQVIFATSIFLAVSRFKKLNPLSFSFNHTLKIRLFAGLLSGAMYTLYIVVLNNYIDPELSSNIIQFNEQELRLGRSALSEEDVEDSSKIMEMNSAVRGFVYTIVCMTFGTVYTFLSTAVVKRFRITPDHS